MLTWNKDYILICILTAVVMSCKYLKGGFLKSFSVSGGFFIYFERASCVDLITSNLTSSLILSLHCLTSTSEMKNMKTKYAYWKWLAASSILLQGPQPQLNQVHYKHETRIFNESQLPSYTVVGYTNSIVIKCIMFM